MKYKVQQQEKKEFQMQLQTSKLRSYSHRKIKEISSLKKEQRSKEMLQLCVQEKVLMAKKVTKVETKIKIATE